MEVGREVTDSFTLTLTPWTTEKHNKDDSWLFHLSGVPFEMSQPGSSVSALLPSGAPPSLPPQGLVLQQSSGQKQKVIFFLFEEKKTNFFL